MASSFSNQIPAIIYLVQQLGKKNILDIGKGFGKYGFLVHEYAGIDNSKKLDPAKTMAQQSNIKIEAVEADQDLLLPHLSNFYDRVWEGDVLQLYPSLGQYELILMIDVIEHLDKEKSITMLRHFLSNNSIIIIATPVEFFQQSLYESDYEHHISHWTLNDFTRLGYVDRQYFDGGCVYILSPHKIKIRGFGNSLLNKCKRIGKAILGECRYF